MPVCARPACQRIDGKARRACHCGHFPARGISPRSARRRPISAQRARSFIPVPIGLRALDVLSVLVERPGKLVTKEEIMALRPGSNELHMTPPELPWARHRVIYASSASSAAASFRSAVSKPSLNQPLTRASNSRASFRRPCSPHNRARLIAVRSSHSFAF